MVCVCYTECLSLNLSPGQVVYAHQFVNLTGENLTDTSLFEEHVCSLLCDLTGMAMSKYSKVGDPLLYILYILYYICVCVYYYFFVFFFAKKFYSNFV